MVRGPPRGRRWGDGEPLRARRGARRVAIATPPDDWGPHIGRKVTMRYRLREGEHEHTELFGVLQAVATEPDGQVVKVMDKRGHTHVVAAADIEAARVL